VLAWTGRGRLWHVDFGLHEPEPLQSRFDPGAWVKQVAQGVADEVEREHGQHDGSRGKQHQMGRVKKVGTPVIEHGAPAGGRGCNSEAKKTHGRFGKNCSSHADRSLHNNGLDDVGKNVAHDNALVARAQRPSGFNKLTFASGKDLRAHQARIADPSGERKRLHKIENAGPAKGNERDRDQNPGQREERIHYNHVDETIDAAAVVAGYRTDDQTDSQRCADHTGTDQHGDSRTIDKPGEKIAAQFIGSSPVCRGRSLQSIRQRNPRRILRRNPGSEHCKQGKYKNQNNSSRRQRIMACDPRERDGCGRQAVAVILSEAKNL
jgi:hypothetical protein